MTDRFAIPGFQTPECPKFDARVFAESDGSVNFPFVKNRPREELTPAFVVYIGLERGSELNPLATAPTTKFIYSKRDDNGTKSYWFRLTTDDLIMQPGSYNFRFVVDGHEWASHIVTVLPSPALPKLSPDLSDHVG